MSQILDQQWVRVVLEILFPGFQIQVGFNRDSGLPMVRNPCTLNNFGCLNVIRNCIEVLWSFWSNNLIVSVI